MTTTGYHLRLLFCRIPSKEIARYHIPEGTLCRVRLSVSLGTLFKEQDQDPYGGRNGCFVAVFLGSTIVRQWELEMVVYRGGWYAD